MDQSKVEATKCSRREVRKNSRQQAIIVLVYFWLAEKRARYLSSLFDKENALYTKTAKHITYVEKNCGDPVSSSQLTQWGICKVLVNKHNRESFSTWFKSSIKPTPETLTSDLNAPIWERSRKAASQREKRSGN